MARATAAHTAPRAARHPPVGANGKWTKNGSINWIGECRERERERERKGRNGQNRYRFRSRCRRWPAGILTGCFIDVAHCFVFFPSFFYSYRILGGGGSKKRDGAASHHGRLPLWSAPINRLVVNWGAIEAQQVLVRCPLRSWDVTSFGIILRYLLRNPSWNPFWSPLMKDTT